RSGPPLPVVILRQVLPKLAEPVVAEPVVATPLDDSEEILPGFDDIPMAGALPSQTERMPALPVWPSVAWERTVLDTVGQAALPAEVAYFTEDDFEYLVEEVPQGRTLWDAWDDPEATWETRFGLLAQVAETLHQLHNTRAMFEGLRPDYVTVSADGKA